MNSKSRIRLLCLLLCMLFLVPCVSARGEGEEITKVATYLLRLREGPSMDAKVLDAYPRGTKVTILKKGDTWTKVHVHEKEGYMKTDLLAYGRYKTTKSETKTESKKAETVAPLSGDVAYIISGIRLNLRDAPESDSEIIGCFRGGTMVTILKKGRYWSLVEVKGYQGYMANDYLTDEPD